MLPSTTRGILSTVQLFLFTVLISIFSQPGWAADQWLRNNNGTTTDLATGLIWQQQGNEFTGTHAESLAFCASLTLGSNTNWRLPEIKELSSIVDERTVVPSIDSPSFPNTLIGFNESYWSATSPTANPSSAWAIDFNLGESRLSNKTTVFPVRCVR